MVKSPHSVILTLATQTRAKMVVSAHMVKLVMQFAHAHLGLKDYTAKR